MPRQTIYERDNWQDKLELIKGWARDGLTDVQIAHNMGISKDTFYKYKKKYSDFADTLKKGKEVIDYEVESALLKNALGFHYMEEQVTNDGRVVEVKKYSKPHTTAAIFWLKNRKPDKFRDKPEPEQNKEKQTKPLHVILDNMRNGDADAD